MTIRTDEQIAAALIPVEELLDGQYPQALLMSNERLDMVPSISGVAIETSSLVEVITMNSVDGGQQMIGRYSTALGAELHSCMLDEQRGVVEVPSMRPYNMDGPDRLPVGDFEDGFIDLLKATNRTQDFRRERAEGLENQEREQERSRVFNRQKPHRAPYAFDVV